LLLSLVRRFSEVEHARLPESDPLADLNCGQLEAGR
jgi:hypothetical protein